MYRQTIIFLLPHQITTVQKNNKPEQSIKSNNQKKQSKTSQSKTATTNNPHNHSIKNTQRQTQQAITKKCNVFEY